MGYDGLRWHVRAFHDEDSYRDFLLLRTFQIRALGAPGASAEDDRLWHQHFKLEARRTDTQPEESRRQGLRDGRRKWSHHRPPRDAPLCQKRLNLLNDPEKEDPRQQHIIVLDKDEVRQALELTDIPWSIQEIRRIAQRLARKRIQPADVIAWSLWRRAHQAAAQKSHLKQKSQL
jgi:hypothetical protein